MSTARRIGTGLVLVTLGIMLASLAPFNRSLRAGASVQGQILVEGSAVAAPLLHYQGRLLDPATGNPKPDGSYSMLFSLYDVATGGAILWSESQSVAVSNGLFSVLLGNTTALNQTHFDGRALWLGVTVGSDPEATPRQRLAYIAYAMRANDAGTLEGQHASDFAPASHAHSAADVTSGILSTDRFSAYADLAAESRIGTGSNQVAAGNHDHDNLYYTQSNSDSRFVNVTGDTMTGPLAVPKIVYTSPRTHYFIVGSEGFVPGSNVDYTNTYGNGGAYISSGSGALVAPIHVPHGAVLTGFKVFFNDTSTSDMTVILDRQNMTGGGFSFLAQVTSAGVSGYDSRSTTSISEPVVDNTIYSYLVYAFSTSWNSSLMIKGALITYTINEAP